MDKPTAGRCIWLRRALLGVVVLLVVLCIGFEIYRQHDISTAQQELDEALAVLDARLKSESISSSSDTTGQAEFIDGFLSACTEVTRIEVADPTDRLNWHGWPIVDAAQTAPTAAELRHWLDATEGVAASLRTLATLEKIRLEPDHPAWHGLLHESMTLLFFTSLTHIELPARRVAALVQVGETARARDEFRIIHTVAQKLRGGQSWIQPTYLSLFQGQVDELAWRLAADGCLEEADYVRLNEPSIDWAREFAAAVDDAHLRIRDSGPEMLLGTRSDKAPSGALFAWLNPFAYEKFNQGELLRLTILRAYKLRAIAAWTGYSLEFREAVLAGNEPPTRPALIGLVPRFLQWHEWHRTTSPSKARVAFRDSVLALRQLELTGRDPREYRPGAYVELEWLEKSCTVRYRYDLDTWREVRKSDAVSLPSPEEFAEECRPVTLSFE